jgi:hypothetical protein
MRSRFIVRYRGEGTAPPADLERLRAARGSAVLDASPRMVLLEGDAFAIRETVAALPRWVLSEEVEVPLPDTRRKPGGAPHGLPRMAHRPPSRGGLSARGEVPGAGGRDPRGGAARRPAHRGAPLASGRSHIALCSLS